MEDKSKIIEKITKLLNLANNEAVSEGERDNALRMVNNLLAKHNINMLEVEEYGEESRNQETLSTYQMNWTMQLCNSIAKLFFCEYIVGPKINATRGVHMFFGKETNAITAKLMSEYLILSILRECRKLYKENLCPKSRAFAIGATVKIQQRVNELIASNQTGETGNALVPVSYYEQEKEKNQKFISEQLGILTTKHRQRNKASVDGEAYDKGSDYGSRVNLHNQVHGSKKPTALLN